MERATVVLDVKTDSGLKSLRQMKLEMRELQVAMSKASDPAEFKRLEAEFAILRNDMKDTSIAMKYLDPGEILGGWVKMTQGLVGSFAAVTGAMSLFGSENEELQKIEKKSMALIQTMIGLEQMRQLLIDGGGKAERKTLISSTAAWLKKTLGIGANTAATATNTVATGAQTVATGAQTVATGGATIATKLLGAAMKALPIFAIIGAVVALVAAIKKMNRENAEAKERQEAINKATEEYVAVSKKLDDSYKSFMDTVNKSKLEHKLAMGEITQQQYDAAKAQIDALDSLDETRRAYAESMVAADGVANKKREDENIRYNASVDRLRRTDFHNEEGRQKAIENATRVHNETILAINNERQQRVSSDEKKYLDARAAMEEKYINDLEEARKEEQERQQKAWESYLSELKSWQQKIEDYNIALIMNEQDREEAALKKKLERELADLNKSKLYAWQKAEYKIEIEKYYNAQLEKIEEERRQKEAEQFILDLKREQQAIEASLNSQTDLDKEVEKRQAHLKELIKQQEESLNQQKKSALMRTLEGASWDVVKEKMMDYYGQGIINEEEYNAKLVEYANLNNQANEEAYEFDLITYEEYQKNKTAILATSIQEQTDKYATFVQDIVSNMSEIFSNLTEMAMIEIEKQDYAWQTSYDERSEALNSHLEDVRRIFGEESQRYKDLLEEQKDMEDSKAEHDKKIADEKKKAEQKYAKFQIGAQMAEATSTFAQGVAGIWATALGTQGPFGIITATALTALLTATYGTQMALMVKQMGAVGKMRQGGLITGPSHEAGGVLKELEGGEYVINARAMSIPGMKSLASQMNNFGTSNNSMPSLQVDSNAIAEAVTSAIKNIPITVLESDITKTQKRVQLIQNKNTL